MDRKKIEATLSDKALKVYDIIRLAGWEGKTCDEVEVETTFSHQTASARINELLNYADGPLIGRRGAMRRTRANRSAHVYVEASLLDADKRKG